MGNLGVSLLGFLVLIVGLFAGWYNSFLLMNLVNATSLMWSLWWMSIFATIVGSVLCALAKD